MLICKISIAFNNRKVQTIDTIKIQRGQRTLRSDRDRQVTRKSWLMIVFMQKKKFRFRQPWVATSSGKARLTCEQAQAKAIPMPLAFKLTSASATCIHLSRLGMDLWASLILHFLSTSNCSAVMPCCEPWEVFKIGYRTFGDCEGEKQTSL